MTDILLPEPDTDLNGIPVVDLSAAPPVAAPVMRMMELARRHGPIFIQRTFGRDLLVVSGLDLVTELADERRFSKAINVALENVREFAGDGLFTAYNDEPNWAKAHDILMPAFALGSIRRYHPVMVSVARRLLDSWDQHAAAGTPVDVAEDMTRMTLDTIGLAGFDFDFGSFERDEPHPFVDAMVRSLEWAMTKIFRRPDLDYTEQDEAFQVNAAYLASVVDEVIATRRATGEKVDDLLGLMLDAKHPGDGTTLDLENIRNQVITFLIAGHETTSGTLAFALYHLLKDPTALRLVQREADELWGDQPDVEPTFEDVGRLRYTRQVLHEALRLWPAAPGFSRQAREDTLLGGRYPMKAGQIAMVLSPMLHRDPAWGDNPELFDPERFVPEAEAARSPHAFKPFGTGERACIGRQFSLHEATMLLAMIAHRYRLLDHADYRLDIKQSLTIKPDAFELSLARRTPSAAVRREAEHAPVEDATLPTRVRQGTGVLFLHGSNYGTCRTFAAQLAETAGELGCETAVAPLDDHRDKLPTDRPVVIVTASYNGQPTDDAAEFVQWLETAEPGAADGVQYAVLGVGDRNWAATYQRIPTLVDDRLAALGGTRLLDRTAADASGDLGREVREFTTALRATLLARYGDPDTAGAAPATTVAPYLIREITGGPLDALAAHHGLTPMTVTETGSLTDPAYPRVKRLVRIALPDGTSYRTADHLTVLPVNDPALVERAARVLGLDLDALLNIVPTAPARDRLHIDRPLTVRELLAQRVELQDRPSAEQLTQLAALNPCPPEAAALSRLAEGEGDHRTLIDLIEDYPALRESLDLSTLLELLPPLRTRNYSASSSPAGDPGHVDLMVSLLEAPARSERGTYRGIGSGYLNRVQPGDTVLARIQPCREAFRVGHDRPVILISAGTGLAPFRGMIADRVALLQEGAELPAALSYFGCDAPEADYLHGEELRAADAVGAVSMRPVFSEAPEAGLRFVQDRITAEGDEVWQLLCDGAEIRVCGDGGRMAPGVRAAFRDVYHRHTPGADEAAAEEWLRSLMAEGRYVEDVFVAG